MTREQIIAALNHAWPDAEWVWDGDDYEDLSWIGPGNKPSFQDVVSVTVPPAATVFPDLTPRQVRRGLLSIGITEGAVEAALEDDPEALIEWRYATSIERQHPLVYSLGNYFELPDEQIDTLWLWAADL